ncbi:tricalbin-3-like [Diospyros lotus]|uniref:tricalbin-3-like n=1 Tax=Diospyros lotus TaxID=55363 RepID=UPI0022581AB6|nr:tricalbin-3-like [Diospyros lotus]XP_052186120.1 tricalbin-3-like [Diospyros lotus]XP_052186121.1 tricalbin-3-like [Diospyros lotus]
MTLLSSPCTSRCDFSPQLLCFLPSLCPCKIDEEIPRNLSFRFVISCPRRRIRRKRRNGYLVGVFPHENSRPERMIVRTCMVPTEGGRNNLNLGPLAHSASPRTKSFIVKQMASSDDNLYRDHLDQRDILSQESSSSSSHMGTGPMSSSFTNFQEDPIVDKLRTQLGVIHPIPAPPISQRNIVGLFVFFFFVGVAFDKLWTSRKRNKSDSSVKGRQGTWPQVPTSFSLFLEKDLQRKESVEWVNMVLGKLWKVYRSGLENWIIGLLQPVIDNLKKPDYVQRVEIKQFSLGDEPLSVRNVERKTSRRVNDLQYQIGLRYTGGARMLLMLSLSFSIIPVVVPVGVRDFDIDGELWVKLRLIPSEPWVGAVSWAFVSLPKIKFELSPFRLFNLMAIPVLSMFLTKLLTEDLPRLFVRPKKIVLDFQKGKAVGPVPIDFKSGEVQEGNKDFVGELSVTLVDAQKLSYIFGKTDPYVILSLGDQVVRSKKNSQTTVIGPPGEPIWNQDFHMLVVNPGKQKLYVQVKDSLGFTKFTIGSGEVDLGSLEDTVPTDRIVVLRGGWRVFSKQSCGEILLRLTYKAYVEDEEDERMVDGYTDTDASDDELSDPDESTPTYQQGARNLSDGVEKESFMDVLAALIVSEEFQGIVASETGNIKTSGNANRIPSTSSRSREVGTKPSSPDGGSEGFGGSALFWLVVITSISVLIATNIGGSNLFNP